MLEPDEVLDVVRDLWAMRRAEQTRHDRVHGYVSGDLGTPDVPEGANAELKDLAKLAKKNILGLVRDAFAQSLGVVGFRSPEATENEPVWELWQQQRLDARQAEPHRAAVTYGAAYGLVLPDAVRFRTPRQLFAGYADPLVDEWPRFALDAGAVVGKGKVEAVLYDDTYAYPLTVNTGRQFSGTADEEPYEHGAGVCPVVRFLNTRDSESVVCGEIAPLIPLQRAINAVNFDRLVVSRFGAFPQKYVIGWAPDTREELLQAGAQRLMSFEDADVKVGDFTAANTDSYNKILEEMLAHVAMTAQIPVAAVTGNVANLSAEALAMAEAPHQRKLAEKRLSFGESWEQLLRLLGQLNGLDVSDSAEVIWRDTEARSFAQVVDGITKLESSGVPISVLLEDVPGWTQQRVTAAREALASQGNPLDALRAQLEAQASGFGAG